MRFPLRPFPLSGLALSLGSLKTQDSCGIGEFPDLIPLADFCVKAGLDCIQLLPVNDTGTESSPYSALSAFALHPIYLRLSDIPEAKKYKKEIELLRNSFEDLPRFDYRHLREAKLELLHAIFDAHETDILSSPELQKWISENTWIAEYAVFMNMKRRNFDASWKEWDKLRTPSHAEILDRWESPNRRSSHLFYAWLQMRLDEQFYASVQYCEQKGIAVKGDIPIMMNEDSCDAWANPEFFRDDLRAGSPPDDSNPGGQNWGFPIYNWGNLEADGFSWWKRRLVHSARYYHAYRIDHILGFFRIWSIPVGESDGYLGWATPHEPITERELSSLGFTGDRLRWLSEPHVPTRVVEEVNNYDYLGSHGIMHKLMDRIGEEELWLFNADIHCEADIWNQSIPEPVKSVLARAWKDRLLQRTGRDQKGKPLFAPVWRYRDTTAWKSLSAEEQGTLQKLFDEKETVNSGLWKAQAEKLLGELTGTVDMLPCAEDLGSIPDSVPDVLSRLGILGLKVIRWERLWQNEGQPFKTIQAYPELSVATTSVHDSSTMRGWWEKEGAAAQLIEQFKAERAGINSRSIEEWKHRYTPEAARWILGELAEAASRMFIIPIQDLLALSADYIPSNPDDERVNIPGTVTAFNWTYRLPCKVETLFKDRKLIEGIQSIVDRRRKPNS